MSFCLKIAILFCEGGKEGAKEGVTSLLCTATSSSKHRLKWVQTSSQIASKLMINKQELLEYAENLYRKKNYILVIAATLIL